MAAADTRPGFEALWRHAVLIDRPDSFLINRVALTGRLQADAVSFSANQGDLDELSWRRVRLGITADFLRNFTVVVEGEYDPDGGSLQERLTDSYVRWSRDPRFAFTAGKHTAKFTLDGATSSKLLVTTERSNLANNLWNSVEYHTGASVSGQAGQWIYTVGGFSSSESSWFGAFDAGYFGLASLGYDIGKALSLDKALLRLDYVTNQHDSPNDGTQPLSEVGSLVTQIEDGRWGLWTDLSVARGEGDQPDLFGVQIMPLYDLTERVQLVFRYTFLDSSGDNGILLSRYQNEIEPGRGDRYHDFYAGVNWYLYGHKLKWQTGVQYTTMTDSARDGGAYDGWGITTGIRISW